MLGKYFIYSLSFLILIHTYHSKENSNKTEISENKTTFNISESNITESFENVSEVNLTDQNLVQYVESPRFPKTYPKNSDVEYQLTVNLSDPLQQLAARVLITFEYFAVEPSDGCVKDRLIINLSNDEQQTYCGIHVGKTIVVKATSIKLNFKSNSIEEDRGFKIRAEIIKSKCSKKIANITQGVIETPNYPNYYPPEEICVWHIVVDEEKFVKLVFDQNFDIKSSSKICGQNYLLISKTGDFDDDVHRFCGNNTPDIIVSHTNEMLIKFNSDCFNAGIGFRATFSEHDRPEPAPDRLPMLTPDSCPCGIENLNAFRVVGGTEVNPPHRYPWMVSVVTNRNSPFCGGVLLSNLYILTASHCLLDETEEKIRVRIGQHSLLEQTPMNEIGRIIRHNDYDSVSQFNDIALLRLKFPIQFNRNILPVCLPPSDLSEPDGLFVAGWGRLDEGGRTSDRLHQINLPQYSFAKCETKFGGLVTDNHICAGGVKGQDACQGDSGGPLMSRFGGRVSVVGVVSWGIGCAREDYPGVYSRVTNYLRWIDENTRDSVYCQLPSINPSNNLIDSPIRPNADNCGIPNFKPSFRIVGGTETAPQEFPWTVVIANNGQLIGSGSLIASNLVLTAARKLKPLTSQSTLSSFKIIVGAHDVTKPESPKRVYSAKQILFHPQFSVNTPMDYDFAIIELSASTEGFLSIHRPICMPRTDTPFIVGSAVISAGWGRTSTNSPGSPVLRKVVLQFVDRRSCTSTYNNAVTNSMVCAGADNKDTCTGDGGGPLMLHKDGRMYLVGVMSWGSAEGCAVGKPSVFGDVRHALAWITSVTGIKTA